MANIRVYSKGEPCHPSIADGITFKQVDADNDLWSGVGPEAKVNAMTAAWMPFYTEAELSRFAVDRGAVLSAEAALETAQTNTTAALSAVSTAHNALVLAVEDLATKTAAMAAAAAALDADPENETLAAALTTASTVVTTAQGVASTKQGDYNDAVATATQVGTLEATAQDNFKAALDLIVWRNGKANPIEVLTLGTPA